MRRSRGLTEKNTFHRSGRRRFVFLFAPQRPLNFRPHIDQNLAILSRNIMIDCILISNINIHNISGHSDTETDLLHSHFFLFTGRKTVRKISVPKLILHEIHHTAFTHAFMVTSRSPSGELSHTNVVQHRGVDSNEWTPPHMSTFTFSFKNGIKIPDDIHKCQVQEEATEKDHRKGSYLSSFSLKKDRKQEQTS